MFTYQSTKVLPYVYLCQHKTDGTFYIGVRHANKVPSTEDFGILYFTSNPYVRENFDQFNLFILAEFFHKHFAIGFEQKLIHETRSPLQINGKPYNQPKIQKEFFPPKIEPKIQKLPARKFIKIRTTKKAYTRPCRLTVMNNTRKSPPKEKPKALTEIESLQKRIRELQNKIIAELIFQQLRVFD